MRALAFAAVFFAAHAAGLTMRGAQKHLRLARLAQKASSQVRKPLTDHRTYQHAVFEENALNVMVVDDPKAAKSGFAVAVTAGSFYDPPTLPGLAHFCEHLLFLGTKKYPDESSFDGFLSQHDGSNNAFTEQEQTVFHNEVSNAGYDEALDRFAQFFIAPLFKSEMVGRELNAVNSEHEKNKPDQGRRLWEIMRSTAKESSVLNKFYTGTVESLHHGDNTTVAALRKYHRENYCATRMNLVMVSNMSVDAQMAMAHKYFDAVPRGSCNPKPTDFGVGEAPFDATHLGQFIRMGTESTPSLWMMFPLPPTEKHYKEAPTQYLEYVLGYAGPGSLQSRLKRSGLVTGLNLQVDETSAGTLLFIMCDLTPEGVAKVDEVTGTTFDFLRLLKDEEQKEVPGVLDSLKRMSLVSFDYVEAPDSVMDAVSNLAGALGKYPAEDILTGSNGVIDTADPKMVREFLGKLDARNVNLALATPGYDAKKATKYEKYYDIHYTQEPIPATWIARWASKQKKVAAAEKTGLRSPPSLKYVPSKLAVLSATAGEIPKMSEVVPKDASTAPLELWWKGKGSFDLPKAQLRVKLSVPKAQSGDARHAALRKLHVELAQQVLEEPTEDMNNCGLEFAIRSFAEGYELNMDGYDQYLDQLMLQASGGLLDPHFGTPEFERAKRKITDELGDTTLQMPYEHAMDALNVISTDNVFGRAEVLGELQKLDEATLREYIRTLPSSGLRVQLLSVGNVDEATATGLAQKLHATVTKAAKGAGRLLKPEEAANGQVIKASKPIELRMKNPIPGDANHATVNSYQFGTGDVAERVKLLLLGKMIADPVYDTLRTKKQLGYVVFGFVTAQRSVLELRVLVQGAKLAPDAVDAEIEAVIANFRTKLTAMDAATFKKWKASLKSTLNHKDQNMAQEADRFWGQIANDGHCFNKKELALQYLETLETADEVLKAFDELRTANRKVSIKLFGNGTDAFPAKLAAGSKAALNLVQVDGDGTFEKHAVEKLDAEFWPKETICRIHK